MGGGSECWSAKWKPANYNKDVVIYGIIDENMIK